MLVEKSVKMMMKIGLMLIVSCTIFMFGSHASAAYTGSAGSATGAGARNMCSLIARPTVGSLPLTVTLTGITYSSISPGLVEAYSNIDRGDGTYSGAVTGIWINPFRARFSAIHTYTTIGVFPISDYVIYSVDPSYTRVDKNASARCVFKSITVNNDRETKGPYCGNGIVEIPEQCDDGVNNGMPGYGCSATCTVLMPKCDVTVTPSVGYAPLPVALTITGAGGRIYSIDRSDAPIAFGPWMGTPVSGTPYTSLVTGHTYTSAGSFGIVVTMFNPDIPNIMRKCTASVTVDKRIFSDTDTTTGKVNTGVIVKVNTGIIVKASTGVIITPATGVVVGPVSFGKITPAVVKNMSQRAYRYGISTMPFSDTQMAAQLTRYSLADMFVRFVKNVKKQSISHNVLCDASKFSDYSTFTTDMKSTITNICDLGLMGLNAGQTALIAKFDVNGPITSDQLRTIVNRYQPGMLLSGATLNTRVVDFVLDLYLIASKK